MSWLSEYEHKLNMIKSGHLDPVYFLYGDDFYLCDTAIQTIRSAMAAKGQSYDYNYIPASETDAAELQNFLFGTSLFQSASCIVIYRVKGLLPSARKVLNAYLQNPPPDNVLIITADELDYKNTFYKRIQGSAVTLMTTTPFENEIPVWIRHYATDREREIDTAAINELMRCAGSDLTQLSNELDKVHIYLPEKQKIREEDIRHISGYSKTFSIDQLLEALGRKDRSRAVAICKNLIENGISEVYLIVALYQYVWKLLMLKDKRLLQSPDCGKAVRVYNPKQLEQIKAVSVRFTFGELRSAVNALVDADRRIKTSSCDPLSNMMITLEGIMCA
jgi:DNA polymerase III subunit delta